MKWGEVYGGGERIDTKALCELLIDQRKDAGELRGVETAWLAFALAWRMIGNQRCFGVCLHEE